MRDQAIGKYLWGSGMFEDMLWVWDDGLVIVLKMEKKCSAPSAELLTCWNYVLSLLQKKKKEKKANSRRTIHKHQLSIMLVITVLNAKQQAFQALHTE